MAFTIFNGYFTMNVDDNLNQEYPGKNTQHSDKNRNF